jgi:hypothetical protein
VAAFRATSEPSRRDRAFEWKLPKSRSLVDKRHATRGQANNNNIRRFTPGGVLKPGEPLLDIGPQGDRLIIDVRITSLDIDAGSCRTRRRPQAERPQTAQLAHHHRQGARSRRMRLPMSLAARASRSHRTRQCGARAPEECAALVQARRPKCSSSQASALRSDTSWKDGPAARAPRAAALRAGRAMLLLSG